MNALAGLDAHFDHVAVAAPTLEAMLPLYLDVLGGERRDGGTNVAYGFNTANIWFPDDRHVELLWPTAGSTFLDSFFARTGGVGGLHHITFTVASIRQTVEVLHSRGYATFGERLHDPMWAEAFVHPRDSTGVLLQVAEIGQGGRGSADSPWQPE